MFGARQSIGLARSAERVGRDVVAWTQSRPKHIDNLERWSCIDRGPV